MNSAVKTRRAVLCLLSFAAGAAAVMAWPAGHSESRVGRRNGTPEERHGVPRPKAGVENGGAKRRAAFGGGGSAGESVSFLTGLKAPPTMDEVLGATGLERNLRMAVWLQTASSAEMAEMLDRCQDAENHDLSLTDAVWLRWTEVDPEAALRRKPNDALWWALAKTDPDAAIEAALRESPDALREVIRSIGQGDHRKALELLAKYPRADSRAAWEGIIADMRDDDLPAAAAMALEKGAELRDTVDQWMVRDPDAALAWAKSVEDPIKRRRVMEMALEKLTLIDPDAAYEEAQALPPGRSRSSRMAKALARRDTEVAFGIIKAMTSPADLNLAYAVMSSELSGSLPEDSLTAFRRSVSAEPTERGTSIWTFHADDGGASQGSFHDSSANRTALEEMMARQPQQTIEILAALPDPSSAPVSEAISQWANQDPAAVSGWLEKQPAGDFKDGAVSGLTFWLLQESPEPDPEAAAVWSLAASPEKQAALLENSFLAWHAADPAAARAGAERLPLSAEQRDTLRQQLDTWDQQRK